MDEEAQTFRRITMKVLTMQLNSTSVMDIVAYGGAAVGMIVAVSEFLAGRLGFAGCVTIVLLASEFFIPLRLLGSFFHIAMNGMAASDKIFAILDLPEPEAGSVELDAVLGRMNLMAFLDTQDGLQTQLQEQAGNLSGGQKQRLGLARALLHDSPVYIFDEATSNIDVESEEMIMEVIRELAKTKTVILISHRLANVVEADRIYMMKNGEFAEQGVYEELMKLDGYYAQLFESQRVLEEYSNREGAIG